MLPPPRKMSEYFAFEHERHYIRESWKGCVEDHSKDTMSVLNRNGKNTFIVMMVWLKNLKYAD